MVFIKNKLETNNYLDKKNIKKLKIKYLIKYIKNKNEKY